MTEAALLAHFEGVKPAGDGRWMALCAVHEDREPSLSISRGDTQPWVFKCFRGCRFEAIIEAAGLAPEDVLAERADVARPLRWEIRNAAGRLVAVHERIERGTGRKSFIWRGPGGTAGLGGLKTRDLPLYGSEQLSSWPKTTRLVLTEGEKAADALLARGVTAVGTVTGASGCPSDDVLRVLVGRPLTLWPDADTPGRAHMARIAARLAALGVADVRVIVWPDARDGDDAADYRGDPRALVDAARLWGPTAPAAPPTGELVVVPLGDLLAEGDDVIEWLVDDRIPCGGLCLLAGKPKGGKSTLARALALEVARGGKWLGFGCRAGSVIYLALEDKRSEVRRHFRSMGATGREPVRFVFPQTGADLLTQVQTLAAADRPSLIIVDTLQRLIRAADLNDYAEVTEKLTPLLALARDTGAAVVLVHHAGKGERVGIDAVLGSTALAGSADNVFVLSRTERYRVLSSQQRVGPDLTDVVVTLDADGRPMVGGPRHDVDLDGVMSALLAALRDEAEPVTQGQAERLIEGRTTLKREALKRLVADGRLMRRGTGRKADPFRYAATSREQREQETEHPTEAGDSSPKSDACSPVPLRPWEQRNNNRESAIESDINCSVSCSQNQTPRTEPEQESGSISAVPEQASGPSIEGVDDDIVYSISE